MKVPIDWINKYLPKPLSAEAMAEALESGGIEVEQIIYAKPLDEKIVSACTKKVVQHPNADKLKLATVFFGSGVETVVCGAPNLEEGQIVALAQVGATLPDGTKLTKANIRGQVSNGMLLSSRELGLSDDHSGILVLPAGTKLGQPVRQLFPAMTVLDIKTQANRFDLQSMVGLAREVAAQHSQEVKLPPESDFDRVTGQLEVKVEADELAGRYMLMKLKVDRIKALSAQKNQHLEASGIRIINPIVDVTNYVLLELGQPLHAFDAAKVKLPVVVRLAKSGEELVTLDGMKRKLATSDLVIADQAGPIALAGVMGGQRTEVNADTTEILLESASFDGATVRKMAQRHGLRSEASARFERGLPTHLAELGLSRALNLYQKAGAGQPEALWDGIEAKTVINRITVDLDQISKVTSLDVTAADLTEQLPKLGFSVEPTVTAVVVTVPWWRQDVQLSEDLAEEYLRLVGFESIEARLPRWQPRQVQVDRFWPQLWQAKAVLKGLGLFEIVTYSFVSAQQLESFGYQLGDHLKLQNPLSSEQAYLRRNLLPSLLGAAVRNQSYRTEFGLYEVSRVFLPTEPQQQPNEPNHLAVLVRSKSPYPEVKRALDGLAAEFHIEFGLKPAELPEFGSGRAAQIELGGREIGVIGELHPQHATGFKAKSRMAYLELDLDQLMELAKEPLYQPISRFPSLYRDITVLVKQSVWWQDVQRVISGTELAQPSYLGEYIDEAMGAGQKSLTIRLEMSSLKETLTEKMANDRQAKIIDRLAEQFGAKLKP